ncbi:carbohydrate-binding protein [Mucilaginibacter flavidus]|uniref:carbohydrate-binding protein n=1 Tax=Mucilaginibacter flavidus TaxID=2949309 RepID=UPI002092C87F|nr:carbohydrate-binding protein [Mucilaginibacter flavidus]MCO5947590.1 carbohydrate-binding protein [Mucilaginibacter flavidus]
MKIVLLSVLSVILFAGLVIRQPGYAGKPWQNKAQHIPGKIECEFYDLGGEGVAYHDDDSVNNGSGKLNPASGSYLNEFRMHEGVDISYTKEHDIDNNPYSIVLPKMGQLYVGWTKPGEWIKYTVQVDRTAIYKVGLMYTANGDGVIALDLDGKEIVKDLKITTTHNDSDTVKWRQWHHWNKADSLTSIKLAKGAHVLTLHVVGNGNMNFDYLEYR